MCRAGNPVPLIFQDLVPPVHRHLTLATPKLEMMKLPNMTLLIYHLLPLPPDTDSEGVMDVDSATDGDSSEGCLGATNIDDDDDSEWHPSSDVVHACRKGQQADGCRETGMGGVPTMEACTG